jgi:hypothetical protein
MDEARATTDALCVRESMLCVVIPSGRALGEMSLARPRYRSLTAL